MRDTEPCMNLQYLCMSVGNQFDLTKRSTHFKAIIKDTALYLCSSRRQTGQWCCQQCGWMGQCGSPAVSLHTQAAAASQDSGRCHQTTIPGCSCPSRPAKPGRAAPLLPAALPRTHSGPRQRTGTGGQVQKSETPLLRTHGNKSKFWDRPIKFAPH